MPDLTARELELEWFTIAVASLEDICRVKVVLDKLGRRYYERVADYPYHPHGVIYWLGVEEDKITILDVLTKVWYGS